ncbi:YchJ family protein [Microbacterium resistens]
MRRIREDQRCPCGTGDVYGSCCGPILAGRPAPTAERLMRSRFTAFAVGDEEHLLRTWHPDSRPARVDLDADMDWLSLDVQATESGGPFDREGTVRFVARYRDADGRGALRERSRFVREPSGWLYVDGTTA